ncbi:hypothetical protein ABKV19_015744 [Rosa sericea]
MKQLEAGFDLGWSVECRDCSLAGKSCGVDVSDLNLGTKPLPYQCYEGQYRVQRTHWAPNNLNICGNCFGSSICCSAFSGFIGVSHPQMYETKSAGEESAAIIDASINVQFLN